MNSNLESNHIECLCDNFCPLQSVWIQLKKFKIAPQIVKRFGVSGNGNCVTTCGGSWRIMAVKAWSIRRQRQLVDDLLMCSTLKFFKVFFFIKYSLLFAITSFHVKCSFTLLILSNTSISLIVYLRLKIIKN